MYKKMYTRSPEDSTSEALLFGFEHIFGIILLEEIYQTML